MNKSITPHNQSGFSLMELLVVIAVMAVVTGAVVAMMKDGVKVSNTTYEVTETQEGLRTAHEFLNRDLTETGDGLKNISPILVPQTFLTSYLTKNAFVNPVSAGVVNLGLVTSDNDVPAGTVVTGTSPSVTVFTDNRTNPATKTDRITILANDPNFNQQAGPISLAANKVTLSGTSVVLTLALVDFNRANFKVGEIYFITSQAGGTFGTITAINNPTATPQLVFATGDTYTLNSQNLLNTIAGISSGVGTLPVSLMRMRVIHYYINSNNLLVRRVFGVANAGFTDNVIAEHVTNLQFRYTLAPDVNGNAQLPVAQITSSVQLQSTRGAEVVLTAETTHSISNQNVNGTLTAKPQAITMSSTVSIRNMQFRQALQPNSSNAG